jgi:hypothetical protein
MFRVARCVLQVVHIDAHVRLLVHETVEKGDVGFAKTSAWQQVRIGDHSIQADVQKWRNAIERVAVYFALLTRFAQILRPKRKQIVVVEVDFLV